MTILSLQAAAQAAGCSRQHLYRLVAKGRISAVLRQDGTKGIDTAELLRVFENLHPPATAQVTGDSHLGDNRRQPVTAPATVQATVLEVELRAAKDALRVAEDRLREAQERENRLLELLSAQTRLLEHKPAPAPASETPAPAAAPTPHQEPEPPSTSKGLRAKHLSIPTLADFFAATNTGKPS